MTNGAIRYTVTLTFAPGLLTRQAGGIRFGLDQAMLRRDGKPVLPGTLVKGNLRHAWESLAHNGVEEIGQDEIEALLGQGRTRSRHCSDNLPPAPRRKGTGAAHCCSTTAGRPREPPPAPSATASVSTGRAGRWPPGPC